MKYFFGCNHPAIHLPSISQDMRDIFASSSSGPAQPTFVDNGLSINNMTLQRAKKIQSISATLAVLVDVFCLILVQGNFPYNQDEQKCIAGLRERSAAEGPNPSRMRLPSF
jgi:hypothetical protein